MSHCDSDVMELQTRLAASELEKSKLAEALLAEKKIKLELSEKTDELNSQLSQQKQLLFESRTRCICASFHFITSFESFFCLTYLIWNVHHSLHPGLKLARFANRFMVDCWSAMIQ